MLLCNVLFIFRLTYLQFTIRLINIMCMFQTKTEIERLTDRYFGALYPNYKVTRPVLVRQARDLLVCQYHGNTARFEAEFCAPAAKLMEDVAERAVLEVSVEGGTLLPKK